MKSMFLGMILISSSLLSPMAKAQDLNFQEYRKFLMNGNQSTGTKMAIQTTCTTTTGKTYRVGEKGYDTCLNSIKDQSNRKQLTGEKDSSTTLHFGN